MEISSRRILHANVTAHPTAEWTTQQFREFLAFDHPYRFVVHDRDTIFSSGLDAALKGFGISVLRTPVRAPKANAYCERLVGTIRRECLDFLIPLSEGHLKRILREYVRHYNRGRPHSALGPGIPEPPKPRLRPVHTDTSCRHVAALRQRRFSAVCTMNTAWKRRSRDGGLNFCGLQGVGSGFSYGRSRGGISLPRRPLWRSLSYDVGSRMKGFANFGALRCGQGDSLRDD